MGTLLKRVKLIPWHELRDSLGSAVELPAVLARVAWSDEAESALALDDLRFRICRDGLAVEEVTATVVPLLWELTEAPQVRCRAEILGLLSAVHTPSRPLGRSPVVAARLIRLRSQKCCNVFTPCYV
jgi:hypothetical protein